MVTTQRRHGLVSARKAAGHTQEQLAALEQVPDTTEAWSSFLTPFEVDAVAATYSTLHASPATSWRARGSSGERHSRSSSTATSVMPGSTPTRTDR